MRSYKKIKLYLKLLKKEKTYIKAKHKALVNFTIMNSNTKLE